MLAVSIFIVASAFILLLNLVALPFVLLLAVRIFKGQIKFVSALKIILIFLGLGLLSSIASYFLSSFSSVTYWIGFLAMVVVAWLLVSKTFNTKRVAKTLGALLVYFVVCFLILPILSAVFMIFIRATVAQPFYINSASMEASFYNGDYLLVDILSLRNNKVKRGEVVVYRYPRDEKQFFAHRVIGLPGDEVEVKDGKVFVNGSELKENYLPEGAATYSTLDREATKLLDNEYFVMGDNRNSAKDSRSFGPVGKSSILGRVAFRAFPFNKLGAITGVEYK
jgi:signal peptidase I